MRTKEKKKTLTIRLTDEQRETLERASTIGPYRISYTEIVNRGIELALKELDAMAGKGGEA